MPLAKSPWRAEVYAPPGYDDNPHGSDLHVDDGHIFFGAQVGWDGHRDLTMGRQDESGRWHPGYQRWNESCPNCGGDPDRQRYCEGCSRLDGKAETTLIRRIEDEVVRARAKVERAEAERKKNEKTFAERMHGDVS